MHAKSDLTLTGNIASWSARHRWWVVAASTFGAVLALLTIRVVEVSMYEGNGGEGDSAIGADLIAKRFRNNSPATEQLVFRNRSLDTSSPVFRSTVESLVLALRSLPEVASVVSAYDTQNQAMVSEIGHAVLAQVVIDTSTDSAFDNIDSVVDKVRDAAEHADGFEIAIAGDVSISKEVEEILRKDFLTIMIATVVLGIAILLIAFRAVVAAAIPIILAIWAVFGAMAIAAVVSRAWLLADAYGEMILLMGMAVGIDYSLFIVSRFRAERRRGKSKMDAISIAGDTTGRAVLYAGITVVLSLTGLVLTDNRVFISLCLSATIVVTLATLGSLTILPAILAILGDNINRLQLPFMGLDKQTGHEGGIWSVITDEVLARPVLFASLTATLLLILAIPITSLTLGFNSGSASLPKRAESRRAVEMIEEHFGAGVLGSTMIVVTADNVHHPDVSIAMDKLLSSLELNYGSAVPVEVSTDPSPALF